MDIICHRDFDKAVKRNGTNVILRSKKNKKGERVLHLRGNQLYVVDPKLLDGILQDSQWKKLSETQEQTDWKYEEDVPVLKPSSNSGKLLMTYGILGLLYNEYMEHLLGMRK